jgi:hypothetical protein
MIGLAVALRCVAFTVVAVAILLLRRPENDNNPSTSQTKTGSEAFVELSDTMILSIYLERQQET